MGEVLTEVIVFVIVGWKVKIVGDFLLVEGNVGSSCYRENGLYVMF